MEDTTNAVVVARYNHHPSYALHIPIIVPDKLDTSNQKEQMI